MSPFYSHALLLLSPAAGGLTFREVLSDLPTDPASLFTVGLVLAAVVAVAWFGRPGGGGGKPA